MNKLLKSFLMFYFQRLKMSAHRFRLWNLNNKCLQFINKILLIIKDMKFQGLIIMRITIIFYKFVYKGCKILMSRFRVKMKI